jgi:hypothetical protein
MAVVRNGDLSRLMVTVQTGSDAYGKPIYKNRTFNSVKAGANDQDVHDIAVALGSLQRYPVGSVLREDNTELTVG